MRRSVMPPGEALGASQAARQQLAQRLQRARQARQALQQPAVSNAQRERELRDHLRRIERAERAGQWISPPGHSAFDACAKHRRWHRAIHG
jgi:uncharacterized protein YdeI (YjbR/CyaY-like superfamily)